MSNKNRKSKLSLNECKESVRKYFEKQSEFKQAQSQFNALKEKFNNDMEDYFECNEVNKSLVLSYDELDNKEDLIVNRYQRTNVEFNPDKLEKALGKELSKQVIIKKYEVTDMNALISYLKECNVDPNIFKSFLNVSKVVDTKELDRLEEIGRITTEQVKGCYTVKNQKPYFTVSVKRGQDNGEQKW